MDKMILKLMNSAINSDNIVRALDLSTYLHTHKAFELALTLVQHNSKPRLAERINFIMQNRFPNGLPARITPHRQRRMSTPRSTLTPKPIPTPTPIQKIASPLSVR